MMDGRLTTLSLIQKQLEFRFLLIGRKTPRRDRTKKMSDARRSRRAVSSTEKPLCKYLANGVQIQKCQSSEKIATELL